MRLWRGVVPLLLATLAGCAAPPAPPPPAPVAAPERPSFSETGLASWYGADHQGMRTANGEAFNMKAMTAAHRDLPFNTVARVTDIENGKSVKVRINDRGPMVKSRIVDLSAAAGSALGIKKDGEARVRVEVFAADQR